MNYIKENLNKIGLVAFIFFSPLLSLAQAVVPPEMDPALKVKNPISSESLIELIKNVLEGVIKIGMPVIVLAIIYSGFLFVSAQGNSEKLGEAKRALLYTLIGAAILLGSWGIAQLITDTVKAL